MGSLIGRGAHSQTPRVPATPRIYLLPTDTGGCYAFNPIYDAILSAVHSRDASQMNCLQYCDCSS